MLPIVRGVFRPRLDQSFSCCLLAPHAARKRQIRSTALASTCGTLSDAAADGIEIQYRNLLRPSRQYSAQQENCRKTANQDTMKTHCRPQSSRLGSPTAANLLTRALMATGLLNRPQKSALQVDNPPADPSGVTAPITTKRRGCTLRRCRRHCRHLAKVQLGAFRRL